MKKVILLALLMPCMAFSQVVENFESGSLANWVQSTQGRWKADSTLSISGRFSLHHVFDNPDAGIDRIGSSVKNLHPSQDQTRWSFLVRHGYDPSSSNNWSVFLMSDTEPALMSPDGVTNGYAIGVNLTGYDDTLRLWKVKGNLVTALINCKINWQSAIGIKDAVRIVVERSKDGVWNVSVARLNGTLLGTSSGTDNELFRNAWFGIYYKYSSTRDRLLWMDDIMIEGYFYEDNAAPVVTGCEVTGRNSIQVKLSEEPDNGFISNDNFKLSGPGNQLESVVKESELSYKITFANVFINRLSEKLIISKICDKSGNCSEDVEIPFRPVWAEPGDIIISEIMADPLPQVSLPGREYLEITNRTDFPFNLKNWQLVSEELKISFPETTIKPGGIMIVCSSQDTSAFAKYGKVTGLKQFITLTDGGKILCLTDSSGNLIHGVEYSSEWYGNELKSAGGWSLEMIDISFPFSNEDNWIASASRAGGTPGLVNSVSGSNRDIAFYGIRNVFPVDSNNISVRFSEPVFNLSGNINSIKIDDKRIADIYPEDFLLREFSIRPSEPLRKGKAYQLSISNEIRDFAGNSIQKGSFVFGLTEAAEKGDILFNELLFNPLPGDPDYIEFYNSSNKIIDASRLQIVSVSDETSDTSQIQFVSAEERCILQGTYYTITTEKTKLTDRFISAEPEFIFETGSLPSMTDAEGHLILYNRELQKIDEVFYNEKMHYSLLSVYEGVALEKTNPVDKSEEALNWHSATESSGWGTPGAPNSVFEEMPSGSDKVNFSSTKITPDSDGLDDFLTISLNLTGNGNVVSVSIFDETGTFVKKIASNLLAGPGASFIWDGTSADASPVNNGIYIVLITLYDDTGKTNKWKKVCTVIRR